MTENAAGGGLDPELVRAFFEAVTVQTVMSE